MSQEANIERERKLVELETARDRQQSFTKHKQPLGDVTLGEWKKGQKAPTPVVAGCCVTIANMTYFNPHSWRQKSQTVYTFNSKTAEWGRLPDSPPLENFTLVNVEDQLTTVGGTELDVYLKATNTVLTYCDNSWLEHYPPMTSKRCKPAALSNKTHLAVMGGWSEVHLFTTEVLDFESRLWSTASTLPSWVRHASTALCGETLYIVGGENDSALSCKIGALIESSRPTATGDNTQVDTLPPTEVWHNISDLPLRDSACVFVQGQILAIGGRNQEDKKSNLIYKYNCETDAWSVVSQMGIARSRCLSAVLMDGSLLVVGGEIDRGWLKKETVETDKTEQAKLVALAA